MIFGFHDKFSRGCTILKLKSHPLEKEIHLPNLDLGLQTVSFRQYPIGSMGLVQGGPLQVINRVITPINGLING